MKVWFQQYFYELTLFADKIKQMLQIKYKIGNSIKLLIIMMKEQDHSDRERSKQKITSCTTLSDRDRGNSHQFQSYKWKDRLSRESENTRLQVQTASTGGNSLRGLEIRHNQRQKQGAKQNLTVKNEKQSSLAKSRQIQVFEQQAETVYKLEANQWIIDVVQRNRTYRCNYAHFLIPYLLTLLQVYNFHRHNHPYISKIYCFVLQKIAKPEIQRQLKGRNRQSYLPFLVNHRNTEKMQILVMMRKFLIEQSELTKAVCPYYYNLFAMVCNKQIVFGRQKEGTLIPYTVKYECKAYHSFSRREVRQQLEKLQKALVKHYHSPEI